VCVAQYADFVIWTPQQTTIFRILKDDEFIHGMVDVISRLREKHIVVSLTCFPGIGLT